MTDEKFWILWCPTSGKPPTKKYPSLVEAEKIAEIMAQKHPNSEFIVCEGLFGVTRSTKVEKKKYSRKPRKKKEVEVPKKEEWKTYKEWRQVGLQVRRGEKATFRDGKAMFSREQVGLPDLLLDYESYPFSR